MALNIIADFFELINIPMFDSMTVVFIISFIIWEIPRSIKLMDEEYTRGIYPETGRVADFSLFFLGALSIAFFMLDNNAERIVAFLKIPGVTSFFLILMLAIPLIVALGFGKRLFARVDAHNSVTIFITHSFLDLMHTLFHISLAVLFIPVLGYLAFGSR
ncbi:MAG: hypothetical protein AB1529_05760 [Candidatus Micrarchaeota archaeon]